MMDLSPPNVFAVALAFLVAGLPFADGASAQDGDEGLVSWLRSSLERVQVTERPRSVESPRRPVPQGEQSGESAPRPPVVLDERNGRGDRSRRPRGRGRQDERADREDRTDRRGRTAKRGRKGHQGRSGTRRSERAGDPQRGPQGKQQSGPPFCRSGTGHPVFGMEWCRERGFAPRAAPRRSYDSRRRPRGRRSQDEERGRRQDRRRGATGITFGGGTQRRDVRLSEARLEDILGSRVLGRLGRLGRRVGGDSALSGRWVGDRETQVLRILAGRRMIAELIDSDRDGRVDRALLAEPIGER